MPEKNKFSKTYKNTCYISSDVGMIKKIIYKNKTSGFPESFRPTGEDNKENVSPKRCL